SIERWYMTDRRAIDPPTAVPDPGRPLPLRSVSRSERRARFLAPVLVAVCSFAAYIPALNASFVNWDDEQMLSNNTMIQGLDSRHVKAMFSSGHMGHYQPLAWLSFAIDYRLHGLDGPWFHRTNVLLHTATAVAFYFLARRLLRLAFEQGDAATP